MTLEDDRLRIEVQEENGQAIFMLKIIKPVQGEPEEFLRVSAGANRVTVELNEENRFNLQEFTSNRIDTEIA
jgi:hypothetical protein